MGARASCLTPELRTVAGHAAQADGLLQRLPGTIAAEKHFWRLCHQAQPCCAGTASSPFV